MENKFSFKELAILVLLVALIASVWIGMVQYDRQWQDLKEIKTQVGQLIGEQSQTRNQVLALRDLIEQGIRLNPTTGTTGGGADTNYPDPFARQRAAKAHDGYAQGDWLIDAFASNIPKITPLTSKDLYGRRIQNYVLEPLITRDPDTLEWVPLIAKSWHVSDDGLTITFQLRRGVVFSDGHPLTAQDVVFTWELLNHPKIDAADERNFYDNIATCSATGEHEVVFAMREPHYLALSMAGGRVVLPKHFYSQYTPDEINKAPGLLLGSGPYRMPSPTDWAPGKLIELVRNERYWAERPAFQRLIWREISNDVSRLTMFRNGEIDLFAAQPEQYERLLKDEAVVARTHQFSYNTVPSGYRFISWNQLRNFERTKFADKRVRQAMTFLTERHRICEEVMLGYATPATGPFAPGSIQADPTLNARRYDVTKAKALLQAAGWEDRDGDGVLEDAAGTAFTFKLTYPSGSATTDRIVLFLKDSYARAGLVMELDPLEWSVFVDRLQQQSFDAIMLGWGGGAIEADIRQTFHSSQVSKGSDNFMNYVNHELDELIDQARQTVVDSERLPLWQACHRILWEDQPYTFMFTSKALRFVDKRVHNIQMVTQGVNDRIEWFVPAPMQRWTQ